MTKVYNRIVRMRNITALDTILSGDVARYEYTPLLYRYADTTTAVVGSA